MSAKRMIALVVCLVTGMAVILVLAVRVVNAKLAEYNPHARVVYLPASAAEIQAATVDPCVKLKAANLASLGTRLDGPRYIRKLDLKEFAASCKADADSLVIAASQKKALEGAPSK